MSRSMRFLLPAVPTVFPVRVLGVSLLTDFTSTGPIKRHLNRGTMTDAPSKLCSSAFVDSTVMVLSQN